MNEKEMHCPDCGFEMEPATKLPNSLAAVFGMAGIRSRNVEGQEDGFLCPKCGKFVYTEQRNNT